MISVKFKEVNGSYFDTVPEIGPIHVFLNKRSKTKELIACYKMGFFERLIVLFRGRIWMTIVTGDSKMKPMWFAVTKKQLLTSRKQRTKEEEVQNDVAVEKTSQNGQELKKV